MTPLFTSSIYLHVFHRVDVLTYIIYMLYLRILELYYGIIVKTAFYNQVNNMLRIPPPKSFYWISHLGSRLRLQLNVNDVHV